MKTIGERLKSLRGEESAKKFGARFGQLPANIYRYEKGTRNPKPEFLEQVATWHGVSLSWLVSGEGDAKMLTPEFRQEGYGQTAKSAAMEDDMKDIHYSNMEQYFQKMESRLESSEKERRELSDENRQLYREKEKLLKENAELKIKIAVLEERLKASEGGGKQTGMETETQSA